MYSYYIITWAFHDYKLTCRQNKCTPKNEQFFYFSLTIKDTEIFPKLLVWSGSLVTAPVFPNRFHIHQFIFDDSSDPFKTEWPSLHKSSWWCCSPSKPVKTQDMKFVRGVHIMLFPQKRNTTAKGRKWVGRRQQTWHKWMGEFVNC